MKLLILLALLAITPTGCALRAASPEEQDRPSQPIQSSDLSGRDILFFKGTSQQTAFLALLSGIAKAHALTPEIQALAAAIVTDQSGIQSRLKDLAQRKGVPLDDAPDKAARKQADALAKLKGLKLDKSYLDSLADPLDQLEASLQAGSSSDDPDIKNFAQSALATLKQERDQLRKLGI